MESMTIVNPDCRTDITTMLTNKDVDRRDHFRVITDTKRHLLTKRDSRLEVGTHSVVIWKEGDGTRVPIEDITLLYWGGPTFEDRVSSDG